EGGARASLCLPRVEEQDHRQRDMDGCFESRMSRALRLCVAALLASGALSRQAHAQTPPPEASRFYVEAVAQSAFSHVVSQSYGAEAGARLFRSVQLFV